MIEFVLELLAELFGELLLQLFLQLLAEFGVRIVAEPFRERQNPYLATIGYLLFGALAGAISVWLAPTLFIRWPAAQLANVVVTPLLSGGAMVLVGRWRLRRGQSLVLLDRFAYGFLFAFVVALVRLRFGS